LALVPGSFITAVELVAVGPDLTLALAARAVVAAQTGFTALAGAALPVETALGVVVRARPTGEIDIRFAKLTRIVWVDCVFGDIFTADPAVRSALFAACFPAALGWRATFAIAADSPRHPAAGDLVVDETPIEPVLFRIAFLAVVGRVADVCSERLALDFALVRAVDIRALHAVAALGRRAALAVAAFPPVAAE
jgi:hypothetical protein